MPWEIGKTYKTRNGHDRKLIAICPDGNLVVSHNKGGLLSMRNIDGRYYNEATKEFVPSADLINPDIVTDEERELVAKYWEIVISWPSAAKEVRERDNYFRTDHSFMISTSRKVLEFIRLVKASKA